MDKCWEENNLLKNLNILKEKNQNDFDKKPCLIHTKNNFENGFIKTYAPEILNFLSSIKKEYKLTSDHKNYRNFGDFVYYKRMKDILGKLQIPEEYILGWFEGNKFKGIFTYTIVNDEFIYFKDTDKIFYNIYNKLDYNGNKNDNFSYYWFPSWARTSNWSVNSVFHWHWDQFPIEDQRDFLLIFYYLNIIYRDYYVLPWFEKLFNITDINKIPSRDKPPFPEDIFRKKLKHLFELESEFWYKPFNTIINFTKKAAESNGGKSFTSDDKYLKKCILEKNYIGWGLSGQNPYGDHDYTFWLDKNSGPYNIAMDTPESKYYIFPEDARNNIMITSDFVFDVPSNKIDRNDIILLNPNSEKTKKYYKIVERIMDEFN